MTPTNYLVLLLHRITTLIIIAVIAKESIYADNKGYCAETAKRPNIVFILVDDMGWGDPACYGGVGVPTPNMDRCAAQGMRFTQFYVASPICSPSRCGLITGQFPSRWRINSFLQTKAGNRFCEQDDYLDPQAPSYVRSMQQAGYATAHIGKWHLGGGRDVTDAPKFAKYGYDVGLGTYESPEPAAALGASTTPWGEQREPNQVPRHERTAWMVEQTLAFAKQNTTRPWLVNLWFDDVHTPFRPSDKQKQEAGTGKGKIEFRAVLTETDRQIGRLLDGLKESGVLDRTLVIIAGDNGPEPTFERARTGGMRGMKWSLYEGGIRTPFIVRWPTVIPAGVVNETTVFSAVDLFPTLCQLCQVTVPREAACDGEDLAEALRGKKITRTKRLFWEYGRKPAPSGGLRAFIVPSEPESKSPNVAVRDGDWKLLINADGTAAELYDLVKDRNEAHNVAKDNPEVAERLSAAALEWRRSLPPPDTK